MDPDDIPPKVNGPVVHYTLMKNYKAERVWRDVIRWIRVGWMRLDLESGLRVRLVEKRGSL